MPRSSQPPHGSRAKVIAAIPCYNTELSIGNVVTSARKHVGRVLVVDDGSRDSTVEAAKAAGASVVSHGANRGYGEAVKTCFQAAKADGTDILVTIDGDGQHNPEEIPLLLAPLLRGEAQVVIGSRFLPGKVNIPRHRRFGISVITWLFNFGSAMKVSDAQSGFRAYSKEIIDTFFLSENGMSISIEILEKAKRRGAVIKEVPISCLYIRPTLNMKAIRHGLGVALSVVVIRLKSGWRSER
jgi:glycosyltransferase involved in cell wall biosynthesis